MGLAAANMFTVRYSTIWLARALPIDGKLITLELSPHHAKVCNLNITCTGTNNFSTTSTTLKVALENLKVAGVDSQVTIVIGPAAESLARLSSEDPYDLVFVDADKPSNPIYFSEAKRLVRKGGVIVRLALLSLFFH